MVVLTPGVNAHLCSETEWTGGDVGRDSQKEVVLERFERFLGLFVRHVVRSCVGKDEWMHVAQKH